MKHSTNAGNSCKWWPWRWVQCNCRVCKVRARRADGGRVPCAVSGGAVHEEHAGHERVLADDQVLVQVVVVVVARPRAIHLRETSRQQRLITNDYNVKILVMYRRSI